MENPRINCDEPRQTSEQNRAAVHNKCIDSTVWRNTDTSEVQSLTHAEFNGDNVEWHRWVGNATERRRAANHWHPVFTSPSTMIKLCQFTGVARRRRHSTVTDTHTRLLHTPHWRVVLFLRYNCLHNLEMICFHCRSDSNRYWCYDHRNRNRFYHHHHHHHWEV